MDTTLNNSYKPLHEFDEVYQTSISKLLKLYNDCIQCGVEKQIALIHNLLMDKYVVNKFEFYSISTSYLQITKDKKSQIINMILDFNYPLNQIEYDALCYLISIKHAINNNLEITDYHIARRICYLLDISKTEYINTPEHQEITEMIKTKNIENIKAICLEFYKPSGSEYINKGFMFILFPSLFPKKFD